MRTETVNRLQHVRHCVDYQIEIQTEPETAEDIRCRSGLTGPNFPDGFYRAAFLHVLGQFVTMKKVRRVLRNGTSYYCRPDLAPPPSSGP